MANYIAGVIGPELHAHQTGFLAGRSAFESFTRIHAAIVWQSCACPRAATVYWDFRNAFPSLSRAFLWKVLRKWGCPDLIFRALLFLFTHERVTVLHNGRVGTSVRATLGIRQGCPTSGILFVIALDAWLSVLIAVLGDDAITAAFADDVATAFGDAQATLPKALAIFEVADRAMGLQLHGGKVILLCLRSELHAEWRLWLTNECPEILDAQVTHTHTLPNTWDTALQWLSG
eukprot:1673179-Amphidinium_carterae.3